jgi:hypothetical protein
MLYTERVHFFKRYVNFLFFCLGPFRMI